MGFVEGLVYLVLLSHKRPIDRLILLSSLDQRSGSSFSEMHHFYTPIEHKNSAAFLSLALVLINIEVPNIFLATADD